MYMPDTGDSTTDALRGAAEFAQSQQQIEHDRQPTKRVGVDDCQDNHKK
jgi:hypothetical protein